jgi:hypothetical protein
MSQTEPVGVSSFDEPQMSVGGRRRAPKGKKGRARKGGTFLAEISVPIALLAATQYMKGTRYGRGKSTRGRQSRRSRKSYRNRSRRR